MFARRSPLSSIETVGLIYRVRLAQAGVDMVEWSAIG